MQKSEPVSTPAGSRQRIPARANLWLAGLFAVFQLWLWVLLPVLFLNDDLRWGWTLVPIVLATTTHWSLLHEAFHDILSPDRRKNEAIGRFLAVSLGASFRVLRFGHIMHHRFNRTALDRPDMVPADARRRPWTWLVYYARLAMGLYATEVAGSLSSLLPRPAVERIVRLLFGARDESGRSMLPPARRQLLAPTALRQIRQDAVGVLILVALGFTLYGEHWPILAAALLGRGCLISFFDNAYHYDTGTGDILSARNLALPRWAERAILNFNLHGVHHRAPSLPWQALPGAFENQKKSYDKGYVGAALSQFRGPVAFRSVATDFRRV